MLADERAALAHQRLSAEMLRGIGDKLNAAAATSAVREERAVVALERAAVDREGLLAARECSLTARQDQVCACEGGGRGRLVAGGLERDRERMPSAVAQPSNPSTLHLARLFAYILTCWNAAPFTLTIR